MTTEVVFRYTHVDWPGFQYCPCEDPGNFVRMIVVDGKDYIECWCGRRTEIRGYDSPEEREEFIAKHKARTETP